MVLRKRESELPARKIDGTDLTVQSGNEPWSSKHFVNCWIIIWYWVGCMCVCWVFVMQAINMVVNSYYLWYKINCCIKIEFVLTLLSIWLLCTNITCPPHQWCHRISSPFRHPLIYHLLPPVQSLLPSVCDESPLHLIVVYIMVVNVTTIRPPDGFWPNQAHPTSPMMCGRRLCTRKGTHTTTGRAISW